MRIILVGPPKSGKTTILNELKSRGFKTFNSDEFVEQIYNKNEIGYQLILENFGEKFIDFANEKVNKKALGIECATNYESLKRLNELIHPIVQKEFNEGNYDFGEIPLIVSAKLNIIYDKIILVKPKSEEILEARLSSLDKSYNQQFIKFILSKWNDEKITFDYKVLTDNQQPVKLIVDEIIDKFFK